MNDIPPILEASQSVPFSAIRSRRAVNSASRGMSLLEVTVALCLSLTALLAAAPALGLALKALTHEQRTFDQEIAMEAAWSEVTRSPGPVNAKVVKEYRVGTDRSILVTLESREEKGSIRLWKLSVPDSGYVEERWIAK